MAALLLPACVVNLELPSEGGMEVTCARHEDCPAGTSCNVNTGRCVAELDTAPPRLVGASATSPLTVVVVFSEPLAASSVSHAAFTLSPTLTTHAARPSEDGREVELTTDVQSPGTQYTLSVTGVADTSGNPVGPGESVVFTGYGVLADPRPPEPLAPAPSSAATQLQATLEWTGRLGATSYQVDVAFDPDFASPMPGSPFTTTKTTLQLTLPEPVTYHWRVRANVTEPGEYGVSQFDAVGDALYVYCPANQADDCAARQPQTGSKSHPFARPSLAVAAMGALGVDEIRVAARQGTGEQPIPYRDMVRLHGVGARLVGGYDATFATKDPDAWPTVIRSPGTGLEIRENPTLVLVEGLTFNSIASAYPSGVSVVEPMGPVELHRVVATATGPMGEAAALYLSGGSARVSISDSVLQGGEANNTSSGVLMEGGRLSIINSTLAGGTGALWSAGVWVRDCDEPVLIEGSHVSSAFASSSSYAVLLEPEFGTTDAFLAVRITDSTLVAAEGSFDSVALASYGAVDVEVERSVIWSGPTSGESSAGTGVVLEGTGRALLRNNLIGARGGAGRAEAVYLNEPAVPWSAEATVSLLHNTLIAGSAPRGRVVTSFGSPAVLVGNLLVSLGVPECLAETLSEIGGARQPATLLNNAFVGCALPYSGAVDLFTGAAIDALNGGLAINTGGETTRAAGNIVTAQTPAEVFVDLNGPDDDFNTVEDNDLSLLLVSDPDGLASAGGDPATLTCGTHETSFPCPEVTDDLRGEARSAPVSVGAYELP